MIQVWKYKTWLPDGYEPAPALRTGIKKSVQEGPAPILATS